MRRKYPITASQAEVGVDQTRKALSMHMKSLIRENVSVFIADILLNFFSLTKLLHVYVPCVYIVKANNQIAASKAVVGVDRPVYALSKHKHKSYIEAI